VGGEGHLEAGSEDVAGAIPTSGPLVSLFLDLSLSLSFLFMSYQDRITIDPDKRGG
jgi:hypothetical protein